MLLLALKGQMMMMMTMMMMMMMMMNKKKCSQEISIWVISMTHMDDD